MSQRSKHLKLLGSELVARAELHILCDLFSTYFDQCVDDIFLKLPQNIRCEVSTWPWVDRSESNIVFACWTWYKSDQNYAACRYWISSSISIILRLATPCEMPSGPLALLGSTDWSNVGTGRSTQMAVQGGGGEIMY